MKRILVVALLASSCASSELSWFAKQGIGQAEVLLGARSIPRVVADPETDDVVRRRLAIVLAARRFARDELGLAVGQQYRAVTFLDAPAVVYVVSAAPRTSLEPFTWDYPVLGALPYRGFFSLAEAEAEAASLARTGLDVDVRPVSTYSLLGVLPDPVVSPMLFAGDELALVETVIHELAHATVFARGQGAFNEGLATFIGRAGRERFVAERFGPDSAIAARMAARDSDRQAYAQAVGALAFDLRVLFAQAPALSEDDVLRRKDRIFLAHQTHFQEEVVPALATWAMKQARLPDNNAELSSYGIYSLKQRVYEEAYASCNEDMRCLLELLRAAARSDDPEVALAERAKERPTSRRLIR